MTGGAKAKAGGQRDGSEYWITGEAKAEAGGT